MYIRVYIYRGTGHCFNGLSCVASQTIKADARDGNATGNNSGVPRGVARRVQT